MKASTKQTIKSLLRCVIVVAVFSFVTVCAAMIIIESFK